MKRFINWIFNKCWGSSENDKALEKCKGDCIPMRIGDE